MNRCTVLKTVNLVLVTLGHDSRATVPSWLDAAQEVPPPAGGPCPSVHRYPFTSAKPRLLATGKKLTLFERRLHPAGRELSLSTHSTLDLMRESCPEPKAPRFLVLASFVAQSTLLPGP